MKDQEELLELEDFDFDVPKYKRYLGYFDENELVQVFEDDDLSPVAPKKYMLVHDKNIYLSEEIEEALNCSKNLYPQAKKIEIRYYENGRLIFGKEDIFNFLSGNKRLENYDLKSFEVGGIMDDGEIQVEEYYPEDYIKEVISTSESLMYSNQSRLTKAMICKAKIDSAEKQIALTQSTEEKKTWQEVAYIWQGCFDDIKYGSLQYKNGGNISDCGCSKLKMMSDGGVAEGNSHDKGGIPLTVKSTGQEIEIEGAEGVVNKRSMQMEKKVEFQGKKLTPCEVVSKINQMGGGVKFKCDDVKEIIEKDGEY